MLLGGFLSLDSAAMVHLVTLPTELDASFSRALPILEKGEYLKDGDLPHARKLLQAAAMTYVATSLMSLLNVGRWSADSADGEATVTNARRESIALSAHRHAPARLKSPSHRQTR